MLELLDIIQRDFDKTNTSINSVDKVERIAREHMKRLKFLINRNINTKSHMKGLLALDKVKKIEDKEHQDKLDDLTRRIRNFKLGKGGKRKTHKRKHRKIISKK